jgi:hypothetical protein
MTGKVYRNYGCKAPIACYHLYLHIFIGDVAPIDDACCQAAAQSQRWRAAIPEPGDIG